MKKHTGNGSNTEEFNIGKYTKGNEIDVLQC